MLTSPIETDSVAARLAKAFGRVSRALRYRTRAAREALGMTDSEVELLRLVRRQPGLRVQDAATELGIASNSVSTLVKQLTRAGLIDRASDPQDGRAACLRLTPHATAYFERSWQHARSGDHARPGQPERCGARGARGRHAGAPATGGSY